MVLHFTNYLLILTPVNYWLQPASCLSALVIIKRNNLVAPNDAGKYLYKAIPRQEEFLRSCPNQLKPHLLGFHLFSNCLIKAPDLSDGSTEQGNLRGPYKCHVSTGFSPSVPRGGLTWYLPPQGTAYHKTLLICFKQNENRLWVF